MHRSWSWNGRKGSRKEENIHSAVFRRIRKQKKRTSSRKIEQVVIKFLITLFFFGQFVMFENLNPITMITWNSTSFTYSKIEKWLTAPFNNMRTLKFKAQSTNAFFATVNQMLGGSFQLPTILSECAQRFDLITVRSTIVGSLEEPPNIWLTVAKNRICLLTFEFRSPHVIERRSKLNCRKSAEIAGKNVLFSAFQSEVRPPILKSVDLPKKLLEERTKRHSPKGRLLPSLLFSWKKEAYA